MEIIRKSPVVVRRKAAPPTRITNIRYIVIFSVISSCVFCTHTLETNQMQWSKFPTKQTIAAAFDTWNNYFRQKVAPNVAVSIKEFDYLLSKCSTSKLVDINAL